MENKRPASVSSDLKIIVAFIRFHIVYFIAILVFIGIGVFFIPHSFGQLMELRKDVRGQQKEVTALQREITLLNEYRPYIEEGLVDDVNKAIPIKEDFFSAISAANQFANRSGVILISHTSPFKTKDKALTKLTIVLQADFADLPRIIEQYSFKSGRLMTIDSIHIKPIERQVVLDVTFHIAKAISPNAPIQKLDQKFIETMKAELIGYSPVVIDDSLDLGDYVRSQNPFGNGIVAPLLPVTTASASNAAEAPSATPTVGTATQSAQ